MAATFLISGVFMKAICLYFGLVISLFSGASSASHPSLFFDSSEIDGLKQKVQSGWLKDTFDVMKVRADIYMSVSTSPYPMSGPGNGNATAGRAIAERVNALAMTGFVLDDTTYINKAIAIVMAAISQTNVQDFVGYNDHLAVGDALLAYTVAYDWLYNYMSPQQRTLLQNEMIEFGDWLYNYSLTGYYGRLDPTPLSCNHQAIVHGSLGMAALVMGGYENWLSRAAQYIAAYFQYARDDTGYNYEGIAYYGYGSNYAVTFAAAYKKAGFNDLIAANPKNQMIPEYILRFIQPWGGRLVALNDSGERLGNSAGMMHLISKYQDAVGLWAWLKMYGDDGDGSFGSPAGNYIGDGSALPYIIVFADQTLEPVSPGQQQLPLGKFFARGTGSFRSSWNDDAALATFTCGFDQHRGHNHRDENSFTFSAFGEYFVIDPGYNPNQTRAHNTVLVEGQGQWYESDQYDVWGETVKTKDFGHAWYMKGQAADAYIDSLNVTNAERKFLFAKGKQPYIVVADDITTSGGFADFTWLLHTTKTYRVTVNAGANEFTIRPQTADSPICLVKFINPVSGLSISEINLSTTTFIRNDTTYYYKDFFKEVQANFYGMNPKFTAVIVSALSADQLPVITSSSETGNLVINVSFVDGIKDTITISEDMDFSRKGLMIPGDLNDDGVVDSDDLSIMAAYWLSCSQPDTAECESFE